MASIAVAYWFFDAPDASFVLTTAAAAAVVANPIAAVGVLGVVATHVVVSDYVNFSETEARRSTSFEQTELSNHITTADVDGFVFVDYYP
jgi:hypothetical protein